MNIIENLWNDKFRSDEMFNRITDKYVRINRHELQLSDQILRNVRSLYTVHTYKIELY